MNDLKVELYFEDVGLSDLELGVDSLETLIGADSEAISKEIETDIKEKLTTIFKYLANAGYDGFEPMAKVKVYVSEKELKIVTNKPQLITIR